MVHVADHIPSRNNLCINMGDGNEVFICIESEDLSGELEGSHLRLSIEEAEQAVKLLKQAIKDIKDIHKPLKSNK